MLQTALMGFAKGSTHPTLADLPPWQIKFGHLGCGRLTRRANQQNPVQPLLENYFGFRLTHIRCISITSRPERGALRTSPARGGMRWTRAARVTNGADADGEVVWF
jgi:hypothetical protein